MAVSRTDVHTFNQLVQRMREEGVPDQLQYYFGLLWERQTEVLRQLDEQAKTTLALANSITGLVGLHEETQKRVHQLQRMGRPEGVEVFSVLPDSGKGEKH